MSYPSLPGKVTELVSNKKAKDTFISYFHYDKNTLVTATIEERVSLGIRVTDS